MRRILVVPIGREFGPWVERFLRELSDFWRAQVELAHPILPPPAAFHPRIKKFFSPYLAEFLRSLARDVDFVLGLCEEELYSPYRPMVFSEVSLSARTALVSAHTLREFLFGPEPETLFVERLQKEAIQALGKLLGLPPCRNPRCVMFPASSLMEVDMKSPHFCPECQMRLRLLQLSRGEVRVFS